MLFADQIVALAEGDGHWLPPEIIALLKDAHKFSFRGSIVTQMRDFPRDNEWDAMCRLPYPVSWYEFKATEIVSPEYHGELRGSTMVGYLLAETGFSLPQVGSSSKAIRVLGFLGGPVTFGTIQPFFLTFDANSGFTFSTAADAPLSHSEKFGLEGACWDVRDATLALQTRNFLSRTEVDKTAHNAKRLRAGDLPLFSHTVCHVREPRVTSAGEPAGGHYRAHKVRGHYNHRNAKSWFVESFARGNPELGFVSKDYRVQ